MNTLLAAIVADTHLAKDVTRQQQQVRELEGQIQTLNFRLIVANLAAASELRKERKVLFENIAMTLQDALSLMEEPVKKMVIQQ